jgi:urea transport system ATP-binding protein
MALRENTIERNRVAGTIVYLEDITVDFNGFKALHGVNFFVDYGELRVLIGPNGAGKTTLLDVICGWVKPESGQVFFGEDKDISRLSEHKIARLGISRKFQTPSVFVNLTLFENVELSLRRSEGFWGTLSSSLSGENQDRIFSVLKSIGLADKAYARASSLSHGEKQWLELGMSIVQQPSLLLVDEPVAGMTGKEREKTGELLQTIAKDRSVLIVEHDMEFVRQIAKKVTVLHEGAVLCEGSMERVQNDPTVIEVYLGRGEKGRREC